MKAMIKPVLIIVGFLVLSIGIGVSVGLVLAAGENPKPMNMTTFRVRDIETQMVSSSDGRKYSVKLNVYLDLNTEISTGMSSYLARRQLTRNLARLDYDKAAGEGGMEYITENIRSWLADGIEADKDVGNIYVSDMVMGVSFHIPLDEQEDDGDEVTMTPEALRSFNALFRTAE